MSILFSLFLMCFAAENLDNLHQLWSKQSSQELYEKAEALHYSGQFIQAHTLIDYMLEHHFSEDVYFLWGQNLEYRKDYTFAIDIYKQLLDEDIDPLLILDVQYRLGIAYDDSGQPKKATKVWSKLLKDKQFPSQHRPAVELLLGAAYIHQNKLKKGVRIITKALQSATREQDWMKARARNALAKVAITQADEISLHGSKVQENVKKRMSLLQQAEEQVIASVHLNKTSYVLQGVLQMVDAYLRFYDDARSIVSPIEISPEQEYLYFRKLEKKSHTLLLRAENYLEKGIQTARRQHWKGEETQQLHERLQYVRKEKKQRGH